jgi:hypothetical protein
MKQFMQLTIKIKKNRAALHHLKTLAAVEGNCSLVSANITGGRN